MRKKDLIASIQTHFNQWRINAGSCKTRLWSLIAAHAQLLVKEYDPWRILKVSERVANGWGKWEQIKFELDKDADFYRGSAAVAASLILLHEAFRWELVHDLYSVVESGQRICVRLLRLATGVVQFGTFNKTVTLFALLLVNNAYKSMHNEKRVAFSEHLDMVDDVLVDKIPSFFSKAPPNAWLDPLMGKRIFVLPLGLSQIFGGYHFTGGAGSEDGAEAPAWHHTAFAQFANFFLQEQQSAGIHSGAQQAV